MQLWPSPWKLLVLLYNILLQINRYSSNNAINAIAEAMSYIRESQWLFHQIISSDLKVIASAT